MVRLERDLPPDLAGRAELSAAEYRALAGTEPPRRKYGNVPVRVDGEVLDSQAEARRYGELLLLERAGEIGGLLVHPDFDLTVNGVKVATYVADFAYWDRGRFVVEDVKGVRTPLYKLKVRMLAAERGIVVREIEA
jgi:hypothetical protein